MSTNITTIEDVAAPHYWFDAAAAVPRLAALRSPQYSAVLTVAVLGLTDFVVLMSAFFASAWIWSLLRPGADFTYFLSF